MPASSDAKLDLRRPLVAGLWLAIFEVVLVLGLSWGAFLSIFERLRYVAVALTAIPALVVLVRVLGEAPARLAERFEDPERQIGRWTGAVAAAGAGLLGWALTEGRRVHDASWRELGVLLFAVAAAAAAIVLVRFCHRRSPKGWGVPGWMMLGALAALVVDQLVLARLYGAFHLGLGVVAVTLAAAAGTQLPLQRLDAIPSTRWSSALLSLATIALAVLAISALENAPSARHATETRAPLSGKVMHGFDRLWFQPDAIAETEAPPEAEAVHAEGIDLRDQDILLITVDALRADRLGAYGGGAGLTPAMDALAEEGVVFEHAYTPTPHTSYALTSLLTGKFMREVLELERSPQETAPAVALPQLLRDYGYRTAAFYPPAIFFVDRARFEALAANGFGFEYRKAMFAKAADRVGQLQTYLGEVEPGHPLFVWVHLFEPHEPYDPPPAFARGDGTIERYEGEIAAADSAVGDLVRTFREHRPGATVILSADHGEELGDHGGWYHGSTLYEEQVRVPLIWSSPGIANPGRVTRPVEILDIATTILSTAGIPRDVRMRGDDLGPHLAGAELETPAFAFASIDTERMATDGRYKLLCDPQGRCRLHDLVDDPLERADLAEDEPERTAAMRAALGAFVGSIPRVEAMAMAGEVGWPDALARAELGDSSAAPDVVPLLGDDQPPIRIAAAQALARLEHRPAQAALARLSEADENEEVRREAALAALALGETALAPRVAEMARTQPPDAEWTRRAAVILTAHDLVVAAPLRSLVMDTEAAEQDRRAAVQALGVARDTRSRDLLIELLDDVRLRPDAATALGAIGGEVAADALALSLSNERYLPAREAEARALIRMNDGRAVPLIRRFLGVDRPLPNGVALLAEAGALRPPSGVGALVSAERAREGMWECDDAGCRPGADAAIVLPERAAPGDPAQAVVRVCTDQPGPFRIGGEAFTLTSGCSELRVDAPEGTERRFPMLGQASVVAVAVVPKSEEVPPPPPEPWEEEGAEEESAPESELNE